MHTTDWLGFLGVFLILMAYILNELGITSHLSLRYILLNLVGASIACFASILIDYVPFIILEGVWALVSFRSLVNYLQISK